MQFLNKEVKRTAPACCWRFKENHQFYNHTWDKEIRSPTYLPRRSKYLVHTVEYLVYFICINACSISFCISLLVVIILFTYSVKHSNLICFSWTFSERLNSGASKLWFLLPHLLFFPLCIILYEILKHQVLTELRESVLQRYSYPTQLRI